MGGDVGKVQNYLLVSWGLDHRGSAFIWPN